MTGRLLFIDQSGQPGGAELCLLDIATSLRDKARVILLADGPFAGMLKASEIPVTVLETPRRLATIGKNADLADYASALPDLAGFWGALRREIHRADLLYFNTAKALLHGMAAGIALCKPGVFHLHDLLTPDHFSRTNLRLLTLAANRTQAVIANSRATAAAFREAGGKVPVHVIPNGFDPNRFSPFPEKDILAARQELHSQNTPVAAVFGRIARWKGQDVLLRAASRIPGLKIWIVGAPFFTGDDHHYAEELQTLAAAPELTGRVVFCGQRNDVPLLMQAADIIVHTSVAPEPFGRVVAEGMFSAKPVIASNAGGPAEMLRSGETGWLVPPGNPEALASALRDVLASPDQARQMGRLAAEAARSQYSLSSVLEQTTRVLSDLTAK